MWKPNSLFSLALGSFRTACVWDCPVKFSALCPPSPSNQTFFLLPPSFFCCLLAAIAWLYQESFRANQMVIRWLDLPGTERFLFLAGTGKSWVSPCICRVLFFVHQWQVGMRQSKALLLALFCHQWKNLGKKKKELCLTLLNVFWGDQIFQITTEKYFIPLFIHVRENNSLQNKKTPNKPVLMHFLRLKYLIVCVPVPHSAHTLTDPHLYIKVVSL